MERPVADAVEDAIQLIPLDVLKDCLSRFQHHGFTEESALRFFRANLALAARRAIDTNSVPGSTDGRTQVR